MLKNADSRLFGKGGVADDAQTTLKSTQATLADSQKVIAQLTALLSDTRNTLGKVDAVLVEAQAVGANVRSASTDLGQLRTEVEVNLRKMSQLTDEVNRKWPFARCGDQTAMSPQIVHSAVLAVALLAVGCANTPPAPNWEGSAFSALNSFSTAYLEGNSRVADFDFSVPRARWPAPGGPI